MDLSGNRSFTLDLFFCFQLTRALPSPLAYTHFGYYLQRQHKTVLFMLYFYYPVFSIVVSVECTVFIFVHVKGLLPIWPPHLNLVSSYIISGILDY